MREIVLQWVNQKLLSESVYTHPLRRLDYYPYVALDYMTHNPKQHEYGSKQKRIRKQTQQNWKTDGGHFRIN